MNKQNIQQCAGVGVVTHVVEEEVLDGREEVVGVGGGVRDKASSRADGAPQKPYCPSPVQDSKRQGSGGLLSRPSALIGTGRQANRQRRKRKRTGNGL